MTLERMIKNNIGSEVRYGWIAILIIIIALIGFYIFSEHSDVSLRDRFVLTNGIISDAKILNRTGNEVYYFFYSKGKFYEGSQPMPKLRRIEDRFILEGKIFPVVVDSTNFSNYKMLFDSLSFVHYGLKYPDSLKWLKEYLKP